MGGSEIWKGSLREVSHARCFAQDTSYGERSNNLNKIVQTNYFRNKLDIMKTLAVTVLNKKQELLFTHLANELGIEITETSFKPLSSCLKIDNRVI